MKVKSPSDFSFVTPLARPVEKGETVEVDDVLGAQLIEQGWKAAPTKGAKSAEKSDPAPRRSPRSK